MCKISTLKVQVQKKKKRTKKNDNDNQKTINKMAISTYLSMITLNVNGINVLIKDIEWLNELKKKRTHIYAAYKRLTSDLRKQTESERIERDIPCNENENKAGVAILISNKIGFRTKTITRDKEEHYVTTKESIQKEYIMIANIYAPNIEACKYIKQILKHKRRS